MFVTNKKITIKELTKREICKPPWENDKWAGQHHTHLMRYIEGWLLGNGWQFTPGVFYCHPKGFQTVGSWVVRHPKLPDLPGVGNLVWVLGVSTGNPLHRQFQFNLGTYDATGLAFNTVLEQVRTTMPRGEDGPQVLEKGLRRLRKAANNIPSIIKLLQRTPCNTPQATAALYHSAKRGHLPWSRLRTTDARWGALKQPNCWVLLAAHAAGVQRSPPLRQMVELHGFSTMVIKKLLAKSPPHLV